MNCPSPHVFSFGNGYYLIGIHAFGATVDEQVWSPEYPLKFLSVNTVSEAAAGINNTHDFWWGWNPAAWAIYSCYHNNNNAVLETKTYHHTLNVVVPAGVLIAMQATSGAGSFIASTYYVYEDRSVNQVIELPESAKERCTTLLDLIRNELNV